MELKKTKIFTKWIGKCPLNVKEKIDKYIIRVLQGNTSNCKTIREGISEIIINYQKGYRVFYTISKGTVLICLAGADKSGHQNRQDKAIQKAIDLKNKLKERELL
jgi:putative addiction module killer protein